MGAGSAADCRRDRLPGRVVVYPVRSRRRKFGSGFRERAVLLRREPKKREGHYLPGFAAERSVRARVVSALWVQTMLVCEPENSASRGRSGEDRSYRFLPRVAMSNGSDNALSQSFQRFPPSKSLLAVAFAALSFVRRYGFDSG